MLNFVNSITKLFIKPEPVSIPIDDNIIDNIEISDDNIEETTVVCNHDWVYYDEITLNSIGMSEQQKVENHLEKLLSKNIINNDILIDKMIQLLLSIRSPPRAKGTCLVCGCDMEIVYNKNGNLIMF